MIPEQELLIEWIINLHKKHLGYLDWNMIYYDEDSNLMFNRWSDREKSMQIELVKNTLEELGIVQFSNNERDRSTLTQVGYAFNGFAAKRKAMAKKEKEERIKSWPQRKWYLYGAINYIGGIATLLIIQLIFPKNNIPSGKEQMQSNVSKQDTIQKNASYKNNLGKLKK